MTRSVRRRQTVRGGFRQSLLRGEHAAAAKNSLTESLYLPKRFELRRFEVFSQGDVREVADFATPPLDRCHVLSVAGVAEGSAQLGQQGLKADAELQRRLAIAIGVQVGTGAQEERLTGIEALAAAEHGGDALLGAQLLVAQAAT